MSRNLIVSVIAAVTISSCCAMQENRTKPFVCESEIGHIHATTKCVMDEYVTNSGELHYRKRTQEVYCVQLTNGDKLSTTRTNKGQGDTFRSIRFGKPDDEPQVDLSESSFRVVQRVCLQRIATQSAAQQKSP